MKIKTVKTADRDGNEIEVPVGIDGKNPVSVNNPESASVPEEFREKAIEAAKAYAASFPTAAQEEEKPTPPVK